MTGYKSNNVDFNLLFKAKTGAKITDVDYADSTTDLSNTYEDKGTTTARANVGYKQAGADLATLFMDIGASTSASVTLPALTSIAAVDSFNPGAVRADLYIQTDGDIGSAVNNTGSNEGVFSDINDWVDNKTGLTSSDYQYNVV